MDVSDQFYSLSTSFRKEKFRYSRALRLGEQQSWFGHFEKDM
jgi:hypothetical protein